MKEIVLYSEAFKLQVVSDIESGKYPNCHAALARRSTAVGARLRAARTGRPPAVLLVRDWYRDVYCPVAAGRRRGILPA